MRRSLVSLVCVACALAVGLGMGRPVRAEDELTGPGSAQLKLARAKAGGGEHKEAGSLIGQAAVAAIKAKDLAAEQQCAVVLEELLDELEPESAPGGVGPGPVRNPRPKRWTAREMAAEVHARLDVKRRGIFMSAPALAAEMLLDAIAIGDATYLEAVRATLATAAKEPKAGAAAGLFTRLAEAVGLARTGKNPEALAALTAVAGELEGYGFVLPALHARLEEAAVLHATSRTPEALGLLVRTAESAQVGAALSIANARDWLFAAQERLSSAPAEAWTAFHTATDKFRSAAAGAPAGRGGHGGSGASPLGRAMAKAPASKALATARRSTEGFDVDLAFDKQEARAVVAQPGQVTWDEGGLTVFVAGPALAVGMLDETGTMGQPGNRHRASRAYAFTWLAPGETWTLTPGGIDVTGKATPAAARTGR